MLNSFCFALALFISFPLYAAKNNAVTVSVKPVKVGAHSYYVQGLSGAASSANQGYMSNAGFVITAEGVVVFDSLGTPPLAEELIAKIRKITPVPIKRVIVSHYHADHIYGLQAFKDIGAEIWAHEGAKEYFQNDEWKERLAQRREELFPWVDDKTRILQVTRVDDTRASRALHGLTRAMIQNMVEGVTKGYEKKEDALKAIEMVKSILSKAKVTEVKDADNDEKDAKKDTKKKEPEKK